MADQPTTPGNGDRNAAATRRRKCGRHQDGNPGPAVRAEPAGGRPTRTRCRSCSNTCSAPNRRLPLSITSLAQRIETLTREGAEPQRRAEPDFRHQVAYALQDLEKHALWPMPMTPEFRSEMTRLAITAPGLHNPRMLALMHTTAVLEDKQLISDIRGTGMDIGVSAESEHSRYRERDCGA